MPVEISKDRATYISTKLNRLSYDICMDKQVPWVDAFLIYLNGSTFSPSITPRSDSLRVSMTFDNTQHGGTDMSGRAVTLQSTDLCATGAL